MEIPFMDGKDKPKWNVGDRVTDSFLGHTRCGTVTDIYLSTPNYLGNCIALYKVKWDTYAYESAGYFGDGWEKADDKEINDFNSF
jgi:hypothetical protein